MNRRGFLAALAAACGAVAAAPLLSLVPPPQHITVAFTAAPDLFFASDAVRLRYIVPAAASLADAIDQRIVAAYTGDHFIDACAQMYEDCR